MNNVVFVLYQPKNVVNVAAVIRLLGNFGLSRLRLIEPAAFEPDRILGIAHHSEALIAKVERFATLEGALADCGLVLATTGRVREVARPGYTPRQAAPLLLAAGVAAAAAAEGAEAASLPGPPPLAAVLFGPEQSGLPNSALEHCHGFITIPTAPERPSLNLAQAALVVAYELFLAAQAGESTEAPLTVAGAPLVGSAAPFLTPASGAEREKLYAAIDQVLVALHPTAPAGRHRNAATRLRALLLRSNPSAKEVEMLTHLFRHIGRLLNS